MFCGAFSVLKSASWQLEAVSNQILKRFSAAVSTAALHGQPLLPVNVVDGQPGQRNDEAVVTKWTVCGRLGTNSTRSEQKTGAAVVEGALRSTPPLNPSTVINP